MIGDILLSNENVFLLGKALIIAAAGVLLGFVFKGLLRKIIDIFVLKRLFRKDVQTYDTSVIINKVFTEIIQWTIVIAAVNYSLVILNFNLLANAFTFILSELPKIILFALIIAAGLLVAKIVSTKIRKRDIERKEELVLIVESVIVAAFGLTALEFIGIKATALIELFKIILYILAVIIIITLIRPDLFAKSVKKRK